MPSPSPGRRARHSSTCGCTPNIRSWTASCACRGSCRRWPAAGMPAVALTDHGNLFAMVKFHREAERSGVKPLIGADLWIEGGSERAEPVLLTLHRQGPAGLPQPHPAGVAQLPRRPGPRPRRCWRASGSMPRATAGLVALSGGAQGDIGRALLAGPARRGRGAPRSLASRCSATASTSRCSASAARTRRRTSRASSRWSRTGRRRSSRPTTCVSWRATSSRRTRRASAFTAAIGSTTPAVRARTRPSSTSSRRPRWRRCSATCRKRSRTASRSRGAVRCRSPRATSSCRPSQCRTAPTRRRTCAGSRSRGSRAASAPPSAEAATLPRAARAGARRHLRHGLRGLLPGRRRLHPLGARARDPGRAGARLGRRFAGRLGARHHRPRSRSATTSCSSAS